MKRQVKAFDPTKECQKCRRGISDAENFLMRCYGEGCGARWHNNCHNPRIPWQDVSAMNTAANEVQAAAKARGSTYLTPMEVKGTALGWKCSLCTAPVDLTADSDDEVVPPTKAELSGPKKEGTPGIFLSQPPVNGFATRTGPSKERVSASAERKLPVSLTASSSSNPKTVQVRNVPQSSLLADRPIAPLPSRAKLTQAPAISQPKNPTVAVIDLGSDDSEVEIIASAVPPTVGVYQGEVTSEQAVSTKGKAAGKSQSPIVFMRSPALSPPVASGSRMAAQSILRASSKPSVSVAPPKPFASPSLPKSSSRDRPMAPPNVVERRPSPLARGPLAPPSLSRTTSLVSSTLTPAMRDMDLFAVDDKRSKPPVARNIVTKPQVKPPDSSTPPTITPRTLSPVSSSLTSAMQIMNLLPYEDDRTTPNATRNSPKSQSSLQTSSTPSPLSPTLSPPPSVGHSSLTPAMQDIHLSSNNETQSPIPTRPSAVKRDSLRLIPAARKSSVPPSSRPASVLSASRRDTSSDVASPPLPVVPEAASQSTKPVDENAIAFVDLLSSDEDEEDVDPPLPPPPDPARGRKWPAHFFLKKEEPPVWKLGPHTLGQARKGVAKMLCEEPTRETISLPERFHVQTKFPIEVLADWPKLATLEVTPVEPSDPREASIAL